MTNLQQAIEANGEPVAYWVRTRGDGTNRTFVTLPGYNLAPDETLIEEIPLYASPQPGAGKDREDAERYRFVRKNGIPCAEGDFCGGPIGTDLDAAIDAAMKEREL